jgi:hypothetical protein
MLLRLGDQIRRRSKITTSDHERQPHVALHNRCRRQDASTRSDITRSPQFNAVKSRQLLITPSVPVTSRRPIV